MAATVISAGGAWIEGVALVPQGVVQVCHPAPSPGRESIKVGCVRLG